MSSLDNYLNSKQGRSFFSDIYKEENLDSQRIRYSDLYREFQNEFKTDASFIVNVPGRVEIGGNHTDHNNGMVVAGSVSVDAVAMCAPAGDSMIMIKDLVYNETIKVDTGNLISSNVEKGTALSLVKGVAAEFKNRGYIIGGFRAVLNNEVMSGSGLSSSAVFEIITASILNTLYNGDSIGYREIAEIAGYAENEYFGKPCGLMDQMACAAGGIIHIDFRNADSAAVNSVNFDFENSGYSIIVVKSGGDHASLTDQYSSIPDEMKKAASVLGKTVLRDISEKELLDNTGRIRSECGDRAFLRALHFMEENKRVVEEVKALNSEDAEWFLDAVNRSGISSWCYLQNVIPEGEIHRQDMAVALSVSALFISKKGRGACRVHGGGFAGTILAFIHEKDIAEYVSTIEKITGKGSAVILKIRKTGAVSIRL